MLFKIVMGKKSSFSLKMRMMQKDNEESELDVVEVDDALAILTCKRYNYKYAVVTPNDIVIPPRLDDNVPED